MNNIPIYRAKVLDSNEYVMGWYSSPIIIEGKLYLSITNKDGEYRIDTSTLAIHFPDMLDSQGNKIFASLSEDGKGGDVVNLDERCGENFNAVALYRYYEIHLKGGIALLNRAKYLRCYPKKDIKVIGIQE